MAWPRRMLHRSRDEARLDAELRFHLDRQIADYIAAGMSPDEAARRARLEFGGILQVREAVHDGRLGAFVETLARDVQHALRALRRSPAFTIVAVVSLALGIGATTAIFSIVDALLLRPLPIRDPHALTFLAFPRGASQFDPQFSGPEFRDIRDHTGSLFSDVNAMAIGGLFGPGGRSDGLTVDAVTRPVQLLFVSGGFFQMLGIQPYLGRLILPSEGASPGGDPVAVLSYGYWQRRFHGDPAVVNTQALVNGRPVTIVGVAPKGFRGPTPIVEMEAYLPLGMRTVETEGSHAYLTDPRTRDLLILARLAPGVEVARANAALGALGRQLTTDGPRPGDMPALQARPLRPPGLINGNNPFPALAALFFTLAGLVFALACLNVANLSLVRAAGRRREIALRAALGGSRARLVRHLIAESMLVALGGAGAGLLVGALALHLIATALAVSSLPFAFEFPFDARVFAFDLAVALFAAALVGIVPALHGSGGHLTDALRDGGRSVAGGGRRLRAALVAAQIAGSLALLIAAGLFVRSLRSVEHADLGFDTRQVLNVRLDPGEVGYTSDRGMAFYAAVLARVRALPGVQSASVAMSVPLADDPSIVDVVIPGRVAQRGEQPRADYNAVSAGYFETMKIPILLGRDFSEADTTSRPRVAVINEAMAERFWPGERPLGRRFTTGRDPAQPLQIVAIVRNSRTEDPYSPYAPAVYVPIAQAYTPAETLLLRTTGPPEALAADVLAAVRAVAPAVPVLDVRTMSNAVATGDSGFFIFTVGAELTGALGLVGLALAVVGMYGVMAYAVGQRTQEIGVRLALGAQRRGILWLVARQSLRIVSIGLAAGLLAALAVGRLVADFLVGIGPADPLTYLAVSALLTVVALGACYVPMRRAMGVDPVVALRHE